MISLRRHQALFLVDVAKLIEYAAQEGYEMTAGEMWRTPEQQKIYVETGRSKTMKSNHLIRLAFDFNLFKDGVLCGQDGYAKMGAFWCSLSPFNRWGGNFSNIKDLPHVERNVS